MNMKQETVGGVEHRLLDGYDGGTAPPDAHIQKLLAGAPDAVRARAEAFAKQRQAAGGGEKNVEDGAQS